MDNQLCDFAHRFPRLAAEILHRDRHKQKNFREETITDLIMAGLVALEDYGVFVDFPDEKTTGADMDWEFVSMHPIKGDSYIRLYIQAKRAIATKSKKSPRWHYRELDHASPKGAAKGSQAAALVAAAANETACCPLYFFYHPRDALDAGSKGVPAIEGINVVVANSVAAAVSGSCGIADKLVDRWRPDFMSLAEILCWPSAILMRPQARASGVSRFELVQPFHFSAFYSPAQLAKRLSAAQRSAFDRARREGRETFDHLAISQSENVPPHLLRRIRGETTMDDRQNLQRPRAIFYNGGPRIFSGSID